MTLTNPLLVQVTNVSFPPPETCQLQMIKSSLVAKEGVWQLEEQGVYATLLYIY